MTANQSTYDKVYVILVNWNGWKDTIECLESLYRLNYPNFTVVICDNASSNNSIEHIKAWARGEISASCQSPYWESLSQSSRVKPLRFVEYKAQSQLAEIVEDVPLVLIHTGANLGFAGGNNVGLRYALKKRDMRYAWLLNNDTVVDHNALSAIIEIMKAKPRLGICGSTVLDYYDPQIVQTLGGGIYKRLSARVAEIGGGLDLNQIHSFTIDKNQMDYVLGASLLVSRQFIDQVGLMNERYFLYFEELDWATRAQGKFEIAHAVNSLVYHKDGGSTGTTNLRKQAKARIFSRTRWASPLSEFYTARNRILFTWSYHPLCLPIVLVFVAISGVQRLLYRRWANFVALIRGFIEGLRMILTSDRPSNVS